MHHEMHVKLVKLFPYHLALLALLFFEAVQASILNPSTQTTTIFGVVGSSKDLPCIISNPLSGFAARISWRYNGSAFVVVTPNGKQELGIGNQKGTVADFADDRVDYSLTIQSITDAHYGTYECELTLREEIKRQIILRKPGQCRLPFRSTLVCFLL